MATDPLAADLRRLLGAGALIDDPDHLFNYRGDESGLSGASPRLVVRPESTEAAQRAVRFLAGQGIAMVPRGRGSGKAGGCIPGEREVVLSTERLLAPVQVRPDDLIVEGGAGLFADSFDRAAAEVGLFYPPDPNSLAISSIGGNVATNAGGPRAVKYGLTGHYLLGMTVVLPDGDVVELGAQTLKCVAGANLTGLLLGSEGTMGLITAVRSRLIARPSAVCTALVSFANTAAAVEAVGAIFRCGVMPRTAELLDELCCDTLVQSGSNLLAPGAGAALILETDGGEEQAMDDLATLGAACEAAGALDIAVARTAPERERVWAPRRTLSEAIKKRAAFKISEDVAVPRGRLAEAVAAMRGHAAAAGITCATYGHAGDGNLHVNLLFDSPEQRPAVEALADDIFRIAIEMGGTITGEHGVGLAKRHALPWEAGERRLQLERAVKQAMDPAGLFNPGKVWTATEHG